MKFFNIYMYIYDYKIKFRFILKINNNWINKIARYFGKNIKF